MFEPVEQLLVSVDQGAAALGLGRTTVYQLIKDKRLPLVKIGRKSLIPTKALRDFAASLAEAA